MELLAGKSFKQTALIFLCLPFFIFGGISTRDAEKIRPHELPADHPVRHHLDRLFHEARVIKNLKTLKRAGFSFAGPRKFTGLIVAKHPDTPGFIYKIYTDVQEFYKNVPEYKIWLLRIEGARRIREYVAKNHWEDQFKVPTKWIYVLPKSSTVDNGYYVKHTVLVEEDMDILSKKDNLNIWKGDSITTDLLDKIYAILSDLGLLDCAKPDNIPFGKDMRIAFIDTQTFNAKSVSYDSLTPHLNKKNRKYWEKLTDSR